MREVLALTQGKKAGGGAAETPSSLCVNRVASTGSSEEELSGSLRLRDITHKAKSDSVRSEVRGGGGGGGGGENTTRTTPHKPAEVNSVVSLRRCPPEGLLH